MQKWNVAAQSITHSPYCILSSVDVVLVIWALSKLISADYLRFTVECILADLTSLTLHSPFTVDFRLQFWITIFNDINRFAIFVTYKFWLHIDGIWRVQNISTTTFTFICKHLGECDYIRIGDNFVTVDLVFYWFFPNSFTNCCFMFLMVNSLSLSVIKFTQDYRNQLDVFLLTENKLVLLEFRIQHL